MVGSKTLEATNSTWIPLSFEKLCLYQGLVLGILLVFHICLFSKDPERNRWSSGTKHHWPALPLTLFSILPSQNPRERVVSCSLLRVASSVEQGAMAASKGLGRGAVGSSGSKLEENAAIYMAVSGCWLHSHLHGHKNFSNLFCPLSSPLLLVSRRNKSLALISYSLKFLNSYCFLRPRLLNFKCQKSALPLCCGIPPWRQSIQTIWLMGRRIKENHIYWYFC